MQPYFVKFYLGGEEIEDVTEREEIAIQVDFKDTIQGKYILWVFMMLIIFKYFK